MEHLCKLNRSNVMIRLIQLLAVIACLSLLACSPQRKLDKIYNKNPHLIKTTYEVKHDTVRLVRDSIKVERFEVFKTDTIKYIDSKVEYQLVRVSPDTVQVRFYVKPDTVVYYDTDTIIRNTIAVNSKAKKKEIREAKRKARRFGLILGGILGFIAATFIWKRKTLIPLIAKLFV